MEAEESLTSAKAAAEDPSVASDATELQKRWSAVSSAQSEVDRLYARWSELEEKRGEA
jgi:ATP-binding cassette subfamily F protein uup